MKSNLSIFWGVEKREHDTNFDQISFEEFRQLFSKKVLNSFRYQNVILFTHDADNILRKTIICFALIVCSGGRNKTLKVKRNHYFTAIAILCLFYFFHISRNIDT